MTNFTKKPFNKNTEKSVVKKFKTKNYVSRWVAHKGWEDDLEKCKTECKEEEKGDIIYTISIDKDCYEKTLQWLEEEEAMIISTELIPQPLIRIEHLGYGKKESSIILDINKGSIGYMLEFIVNPSADNKLKSKFKEKICNYSCFCQSYETRKSFIAYYVHQNKENIERDIHY